MKNYDNKELLNLKYWDVNSLYGWAVSQRLPFGGFEWVQKTSQFNEDLIKSYNDDSNVGYFLKVYFQYPENLPNLLDDLPFCLKE